MNKKKMIIVLSIIVLSGLLYLIYNLFGVDLQIKINYGINVPIADIKLYNYHDEIGRDTSYYHVVKYNSMKLKRIRNFNWTQQIRYNNKELTDYIKKHNQPQIKYDEQLFNWLKDNNVQKEYYPVIDENTLYFKKDFGNKLDYLLMIYNTKTNIVNIYEFHI